MRLLCPEVFSNPLRSLAITHILRRLASCTRGRCSRVNRRYDTDARFRRREMCHLVEATARDVHCARLACLNLEDSTCPTPLAAAQPASAPHSRSRWHVKSRISPLLSANQGGNWGSFLCGASGLFCNLRLPTTTCLDQSPSTDRTCCSNIRRCVAVLRAMVVY